jgi:amidase
MTNKRHSTPTGLRPLPLIAHFLGYSSTCTALYIVVSLPMGLTRAEFLQKASLLSLGSLAGCSKDESASSVEQVSRSLRLIQAHDHTGPCLRAVIELNPDALAIAASLDRESSVSSLYGAPVLVKDNIDTHDRMATTAGSLALEGSIAPKDAFVVEKLRAAGLVIVGKTNLSEWANFRGSRSISGWSGRGGQTLNPHCLDRSPSGSSSGSAAAVAMGYTPYAIGTETNGSIVSPAACCGIVGFKPTVGLVSRSGIIPIAASQDTAGPMTQTVKDAAALLAVIMGSDVKDEATTRQPAYVEQHRAALLALKPRTDVRVGIARDLFSLHPLVDPVYEKTLSTLKALCSSVVDPVELPSTRELAGADYKLMLYEFKAGLNAYLHNLVPNVPVRTMEDVIAFNARESKRELWLFGQERLIQAASMGSLAEADYKEAKAHCLKWSAKLTDLMEKHQLDAIAAPTSGPAATIDFLHGDRGLGGCSTYAAVAGLPHITVPCGQVGGLPVGLSFFGPAWSEPTLAGIALAFEQATKARLTPALRPMVSLAEPLVVE